MSNPIIEVTSLDELKRLLAHPLAVVCFSKENCQPCSMVYRSLEQVAAKEREVPVLFIVAKMEVIGTEYLQEQGIRSVPTLSLFKGGNSARGRVGFQSPTAIEDLIGQ